MVTEPQMTDTIDRTIEYRGTSHIDHVCACRVDGNKHDTYPTPISSPIVARMFVSFDARQSLGTFPTSQLAQRANADKEIQGLGTFPTTRSIRPVADRRNSCSHDNSCSNACCGCNDDNSSSSCSSCDNISMCVCVWLQQVLSIDLCCCSVLLRLICAAVDLCC